ncbi:MAG: hypothetical protein RLZZ528_987 [Pseudomonadota bacterium]
MCLARLEPENPMRQRMARIAVHPAGRAGRTDTTKRPVRARGLMPALRHGKQR